MCSNYLPARIDSLASYFDVEKIDLTYPAEVYPGNIAPILRAGVAGVSGVTGMAGAECVLACFGMVPHWAELRLARQTYNARSETVAEKPSFRSAWRKQQFCVIPVEAFFEPNYESGRAVRWKVAAANGQPLGVAGIWEWRRAGIDGRGDLFSFSMLTINADHHPLMRRFHQPEDEKRMLVILPPDQYTSWLGANIEQALELLQASAQTAPELTALAAPRLLLPKTAGPGTAGGKIRGGRVGRSTRGGRDAKVDSGQMSLSGYETDE
jgi:putative SOS response-associated peptidase YedK